MNRDYTALLRASLQRGNSLDAALDEIKQQGARLGDLIQAVQEVKAVSRQDAIFVVLSSPICRDFRDEIDRMSAKILASKE
jgi:hypothetical protein